jgi:hypothetical protein
MEETFKFLDKLATRYLDDQAIQLALAIGTQNALNHFSKNDLLEDMQNKFDLLQLLAEIYPDHLAFQVTLATATITVIKSYAKTGNLVETRETFKVLTRVAESFPNEPLIKKLVIRGQEILQEMEGHKDREPQADEKHSSQEIFERSVLKQAKDTRPQA